ncbi:MAG: ATP-dependent helicase [Gemmatimonadetes bacterium]|jgi:ATP-dependent Lhr-like helicase|nr:ATP-dependent helicase [Gemmatimonadota bacterium]
MRLLTPPVRDWVADSFGTLTPPQVAAIPAIHAGEHVLVSAPTGTGKTLAAFLAVLSELVASHEAGTLGSGIQAVYVSPLRALGTDVQRNLERPLAEIVERLGRAATDRGGVGGPPDNKFAAEADTASPVRRARKRTRAVTDAPAEPDVPIRVAARTGDSTPAERRKLVTSPPHVLVTTPESLAILLSTASMSEHFRSVRWVIVDEVHAMAGGKRGVHLALSLERLAAAADRDPVRVGLSATVAPLDVVARWLCGVRRTPLVVAWRAPRDAVFTVQSALAGEVVPNPQRVQRAVTRAVSARVTMDRTTLVFTNTRGATERLAHRLRERFGDTEVAAHHSSLAREERVLVEERLREGSLRVVVTSTSLELGIDIGSVDEVVLVSSPRDVTRALQRIGRSGHRIDRHPRGRFIGTGVDDVLECLVVSDRCRAGALDPIRVPVAPLDVLAQQLVGMAAVARWREDDAFALVRRAAPYADLARADFDDVLDYLADTSEAMAERRVYARLVRTDGWFEARGKSVATIFYQNVGTITGGASIRVKPRGSPTPIGTVEEDFLEQLRPGDRFLLGGRVWAFMYAQGMTAFVAPASGRPSVPRWASEILPATAGVAWGVGVLRARLRDAFMIGGTEAVSLLLGARYDIGGADAGALADYVATQHALSPIPDPDEVLVERWADADDPRLVVHAVTSPLGRRANEALARALAWRLGRGSVGLMVDDQSFALRVPKRAAWDDAMLARLFDPLHLHDDVRAAVARSDLWGRRFRAVAGVGLMLVKNFQGRSKFVGAMQMNARRIWTVLERERPLFPLVRETYRTVLEDDLDIPSGVRWLEGVRGRITVRDLEGPPPFLFRLVAAGTTDSMLLEERDAFLRRLWERAVERSASVEQPAAPA